MTKMRQWSVLTAVGALAILVAGWFLLVSPQRSHASDLRSQAATQQTANQSLAAQVAQLRQQQKDLPAQQRKLSQIAAKIPNNPMLPALIRQLSAAAQGTNVDLVSLAPGAPAAVTATGTAAATPTAGATAAAAVPLAQIPVTLQVTGNYFNIEQFFASVEKLTRAMRVNSFTLVPATSGSSAGGAKSASGHTLAPGDLNGSIQAVVFMSPDTTTPAAPAAPVSH